MMYSLGADYFGPAYGPSGETSTGTGDRVVSVIGSALKTISDIWGRNDLTTQQKQDQSGAAISALNDAAKTNQTAILTIGGVVVAGLVAFALFRKK